MRRKKHSRANEYRPSSLIETALPIVNPSSSGTVFGWPHMTVGISVGTSRVEPKSRDNPIMGHILQLIDKAKDDSERACWIESGVNVGSIEIRTRIGSIRVSENQTRLRDLQGGNVDIDIIVDFFERQHTTSLADYNAKLKEYQKMCAQLQQKNRTRNDFLQGIQKLNDVLEAKYRLEVDQATLNEVRTLGSKKPRTQPPPPVPPPSTVVASTSVAAASSREDKYARIDTLSALFETSGRHHGNCDGKCCQPGACCISSGYLDRGKTKKDPGGKSYGRHQFASAPEVGTLQGFLHNNPVIERDFAGLAIGSDAFDQKWIEMSHQKSFVEAQDKFIIKTNFTPVRKTANEVCLLNTEIIDQILYSCGVQHGPGGANQIVRNAARELESIGKLNDEQMTILCLYKHRAGYIDGIPDSKISPENKAALKQNRCVEEREEALKTFAGKQSPALERPPAVVAQGLFRSQQDDEEAKKEVVPASSSAPAVDATPARR